MKTYVLIPMIEHTQNSIPRSMPLKAMMILKNQKKTNILTYAVKSDDGRKTH